MTDRPDKTIWFDAPATRFTESSPIGNGRLGAMLFGGIAEECIVLNESGMWSGSPQDADRPDAAEALPEIRHLLLAGRIVEAEKLVGERFTCLGAGSGRGVGANVPFGCYQTLGDLRLIFLPTGAGAPVTGTGANSICPRRSSASPMSRAASVTSAKRSPARPTRQSSFGSRPTTPAASPSTPGSNAGSAPKRRATARRTF